MRPRSGRRSEQVRLRTGCRARGALLVAAAIGGLPLAARATTYTVTQTTDDGKGDVSGSLSWAIDQANANAGSTIDFSLGGDNTSIELDGSLPQITAAVTIDGSGVRGVNGATGISGLIIDGQSDYRAFFVNDASTSAPDVTIENLTVLDGMGKGGNGEASGGGGGLGAGGGLYVGAGNVSVVNVGFSGSAATGGKGGNASSGDAGGGGGGLGGSGGQGASLTFTGGGGGGGGYSGNGVSGTSGAAGSGGGYNGTGGGIASGDGTGGSGGPNGGGGGSSAGSGGAGGMYGGGGGGSTSGGAGGFGGGGGGGGTGSGGAAGFGGGAGGNESKGGGGGSALGGAVFVQQGATISFTNTSLDAGTLSAGAAGSGGSAAAGTTAGSSMYLMGGNTTFNVTEGGISAVSGSIAEAPAATYGPSSITIANAGGGGTVVLAGNNSYSGGTTVDGATLAISNDANLGAASGGLTLEDGATLQTSSSVSSARAISLGSGAGGQFDIAAGTTTTLSGVVSGGALSMVNDAGTLVLSGSNTYTGTTSIDAGTLSLAATGSIADSAGVNLAASGAVLDISAGDQTIQGLSGVAGTTVNLGSSTLTTGGAANTSFAGVIQGMGSLTMAGTGTLTLSGNNTFSGNVDVGSGTLRIGGGSTGSGSSDITVDGPAGTSLVLAGNADGSGANLTCSETDVGYSNTGTATQSGGSLYGSDVFVAIGAGSSGTYNMQGGQVYLSDGLTVDLEGGSGVFNQTGGTVSVAGNVNLNTEFAAGTATYNLSGGTLVAGEIVGGAGTFNFNGGTLVANQDGNLIVADQSFGGGGGGGGGTLVVTADTSSSFTVNVLAGGATIDAAGYNVTIAAPLVDNSNGALTVTGGGTLELENGLGVATFNSVFASYAYNGSITIESTTLVIGNESGLDGSFTTPVNILGNGQLVVTSDITTDQTFNLSGAAQLSAADGKSITYEGATVNGGFLGSGSHIMDDGSSFNGTTLLAAAAASQSDGGTVNMDVVTIRGSFTQTAGTLNDNNGLTTSSGSMTIGGTLNTVGVESDGMLSVNPGGTINNSEADLVLGGGSRTYLGSAGDTGGSIVLASGTAIDVNGGLLDNNGTITGGPVNVNYGGEAMGAGSYQSVIVNRGGTFHAGNSPGIATVTDYTFGPGSSFEFDIDDADGTHGADWSLVDASGTVDITATSGELDQAVIEIDSLMADDSAGAVPNFDPTQSYTWDFVDGGAIDGFSPADFSIDTSNFSNSLDGGSFSVVQSGNNLYLQFTPVPEPTSMIALLPGAAGILMRRRRR